ncbi:MAG: hypothetical protein IJV22_06940 [Bacteroidales bacterium]|nr:hypothetical protein [Bacteroidales bacterium]
MPPKTEWHAPHTTSKMKQHSLTILLFGLLFLTNAVYAAASHSEPSDLSTRSTEKTPVYATADSTPATWRLRWSGFVNPHFYADSREVVGGRETMMLFYPQRWQSDAEGRDLNNVASWNMLAITARLGLHISGPDMMGAHTRAYIEGDFTGATNATINNLRLRHAYFQLNWTHSQLLAGQYWHPLVAAEVMPNTRPLNMGAPFHPYCRQGLISYDYRLGRWDFAATLSSQLDNMSDGPQGGSPQYLRHSPLPESNLTIRYRSEQLLLGAGVHLITLRPRTSYSDSLGIHATSGLVSAPSLTCFMRYSLGNWSLRAQYLYANNLSEIASMGGYSETFSPTQNSFSYNTQAWHLAWVDFGRANGHWRPGLFLAYGNAANFGQTMFDPAYTTFYGRGYDIHRLWRIQPRIGYHANDHFNVYFEAEYTEAHYAMLSTPVSSTMLQHYVVDPLGSVGNLRLMLSAEYHF